MSKYQRPRGIRRAGQRNVGTMHGGKLYPVAIDAFEGSESGTLSVNAVIELEPIAGRMISEVYAHTVSVFVPVQAMDDLKNPGEQYAGAADVIREKLLSGTPIFDLEDENVLSKTMRVNPISINGEKKVSETVRLGHNAAINFLRRKKYVKAAQLAAADVAITPALLGSTILQRLNAVLDPEDRVNGAVNLQGQLPLKGIGVNGSHGTLVTGLRETLGTASRTVTGWVDQGANDNGMVIEEDANNPGFPSAYADMAGVADLSLTDMYIAERTDQLTREMRAMVDGNPEFGEEMVARWAHGLSVDPGNQPFVLYEKEMAFSAYIESATDGPSLDTRNTNMTYRVDYLVPVPKTEFGGVVVTFLAVKPDETLPSQPHPVLTRPWTARNFVADELAIDPVPITIRDVNAECNQVDENTVIAYGANNGLMRNYSTYGFNREMDPNTVANKTALWQLEIPMSVTPETVVYPASLPAYPWADQLSHIARYRVETLQRVVTPIIFGPTPVEELAAIEDLDVFEDAQP